MDARTVDARRARPDAEPAPEQDAGFDLCLDVREDCEPAYQGEWFTTFLRASDFGADAEFLAMGGDAVLLAHDGQQELLRVDTLSKSFDRFAVPTGWRGIDVQQVPYPERTVWLLACREESECVVFAGTDPAQPLTQLGPALPFAAWIGITPSGSFTESGGWDPCVYGTGLTRLVNGQWSEKVAPSVEVAAARYPGWALATALTTSGEVLYADPPEGFFPDDLDLVIPGRVRSFLDTSATIVTDRVVVDLGDWTGPRPQCARSDLILADRSQLLFEDGRLAYAAPLSCVAQRLPPLTDLVETGVGGECSLPRVLTKHEFIGASGCAFID